MEKFCQQICKIEELSSKLKCYNIVALSEAGKAIPTLADCLELIRSRHIDETVDVVIDEYDSEELTMSEAKRIHDILQTATFAESCILVAVQSCQKKRIVEGNTEILPEESHCFESTGMEVKHLVNTMRFTSNIHHVVNTSERAVENIENVYSIPQTTTRPRKQRALSKDATTHHHQE